MMRRSIWLSLALGLALAGARTSSATDYWDFSLNNDNGVTTKNQMYHGTSQQHDLQTNPGPVADQDWYFVPNFPGASYEAVIDSTSFPLDFQTDFQRLDFDATTVLQSSEEADVGYADFSRALRWQGSGATILTQFLRAQSSYCGVICGFGEQYHIRFYETTVAVPRFNNAGGQVTVLIVQNPTGWTRNIAGTVYFWSSAGTLLGNTTFSLAAKAALVLNTGTVPGVAGQSGTITIAHDGGYGNLAIKAVALEPATGFSFDPPGLYKPL